MADFEVPNFVNVFAQSAAAGRQVAQQRQRQNALALLGTDPVAAENALMQAGDFESANALASRRELQRKIDLQTAQTQARGKAVKQFEAGDVKGAQSTAMGAGLDDLATHFTQASADERKAIQERTAQLGGTAAALLQTFQNNPQEGEAVWQATKPLLIERGLLTPEQADSVVISAADPQHTVSTLQSFIGLTRTADQVFDQINKDREFKLDSDKFDYQKDHDAEVLKNDRQRLNYEGQRVGLERERVGIARDEAKRRASEGNGGLTPAQARKAEGDLRKEFDRLPEVKNYRTVAQQARTVQQFAKGPPSAQGDIALIYSTMKVYDPTSVVRETEFATAQNAAGVPDRIRNQWNKVLRGQRLTPRQRQEMADAVKTVADSAKQRFDTIQEQYRGYAKDYGGNPDRVAPISAGGVIRYDANGNRIQ
jgi:hypothetical protein